ncbi:MAG: branched-chain amino acid aminotransferase [Planctomycetota bacterium]
MSNSSISVTPTKTSRLGQVRWDQLGFGRIFSDHMLVADFRQGAWQPPAIVPYGPIAFTPSMSSLHYGQSIFEGMKSTREHSSGAPLLFRPRDNWQRMNCSARRLCMPELPEAIFLDGLRALVRVDRDWLPPNVTGSLYIRPVLFATDEFVGVRPSDSYKFVIFTSPVGAYYSEPVALCVLRNFARACEGGTGSTKMAGNYAGCLLGTREAQKKGYKDVMWLDAKDHRAIEECGTMNIFFVIGGEVITPPASGTILAGVTRESVITLLRDAGRKVSERRIEIEEVVAAHAAGRLEECFGTGTAATVSHVSRIGVDGVDLQLPPIAERRVAQQALDELTAIRTGRANDRYGWIDRP